MPKLYHVKLTYRLPDSPRGQSYSDDIYADGPGDAVAKVIEWFPTMSTYLTSAKVKVATHA